MIIGHDLRSVQTDHPMVIITSVMGERVAQFHVVSDLVGKIYWNTNAVAPGLYIVYLVSDKGILESKKITVIFQENYRLLTLSKDIYDQMIIYIFRQILIKKAKEVRDIHYKR